MCRSNNILKHNFKIIRPITLFFAQKIHQHSKTSKVVEIDTFDVCL